MSTALRIAIASFALWTLGTVIAIAATAWFVRATLRSFITAYRRDEAEVDAVLADLARNPSPPLVVAAPPAMEDGHLVVGVVEDWRVSWLTEMDPAAAKPERLH